MFHVGAKINSKETYELNNFFESVKSKINRKSKKWIVMGNEAADMDSVVGSLVYGFHKQCQISEFDVIPVVSIKRKYLSLRKDILLWLKECQIDDNKLIFLDDVQNLFKFPEKCDLRITLIDHHKPIFSEIEKYVVEVIDHREKVFNFPSKQIQYEKIELVGSCCTLLTSIVMENKEMTKNKQILKLLYGVILLDTENFNPKIGKTTQMDIENVEAIEKHLNIDVNTRDRVSDQLKGAKSDINGLSLELLVHKDLKFIELIQKSSKTQIKFAIPSLFQMELTKLFEEPNFYKRLQQILGEMGADILILISSLEAGVREFVIYSENVSIINDLTGFLVSKSNNLDFKDVRKGFNDKIILFHQNHLLLSRKKFIPYLIKYAEN